LPPVALPYGRVAIVERRRQAGDDDGARGAPLRNRADVYERAAGRVGLTARPQLLVITGEDVVEEKCFEVIGRGGVLRRARRDEVDRGVADRVIVNAAD